MNVRPLHDKIFFSFLENIVGKNFMPISKEGIILTDNYDFSEVRAPKWGKVLRCGAETSADIQPGNFILVEPGKWTNRINHGDEPFWMTEENFVMMVTDDETVTTRY